MPERFSHRNSPESPSKHIGRAAIIAALATPACVYPTPALQKELDEACAKDPQALIGTQGSYDDGVHAYHLNCEIEPAYEARYGMVGEFEHGVAMATTTPFDKKEQMLRNSVALAGGSSGRNVVVINREGKPILEPIYVTDRTITPEYYLLETHEGGAYLFKHGKLFAKYDRHYKYGDREIVAQNGKWHLLAKDGEPENQSFEDKSAAFEFIDCSRTR